MKGSYRAHCMRGAYAVDYLTDERLAELIRHCRDNVGKGENPLNTRDTQALLDACHEVARERASKK
jgi:hypothetical protein